MITSLTKPTAARMSCAMGAAGLALSVSACTTWSQPDPPPSTSGPVGVSATVHFSSREAPKCTGTVVWTFTPVQLTGTDGETRQVVNSSPYDVSGLSGTCSVSGGRLGLKQGVWRIASNLDDSCEIKLTASVTTVIFRDDTSGCTHLP